MKKILRTLDKQRVQLAIAADVQRPLAVRLAAGKEVSLRLTNIFSGELAGLQDRCDSMIERVNCLIDRCDALEKAERPSPRRIATMQRKIRSLLDKARADQAVVRESIRESKRISEALGRCLVDIEHRIANQD